jgi:aminopeptidase N
VRYATRAPSQALDGTVTIVARATQSLSRFDLDFAGDSVGSVAVDGRSARWRRDGEELVIKPAHDLRRGSRVGRYPFDIFGTFVVDAELGFALETQTISLLDRVWFSEFTQDVWDPTMLHELSHMWFGDSVSPHSWSDLWLNEGHASWYEFLYAEARGQLAGDTEGYPDDTGYATMDELMKAVYAHGDEWRASDGPVAAPLNSDVLFNLNRYHGGALVLYALRQKIGGRAFDRLEREWVSRYRDRVASTEDFIALASKVAHRDLRHCLSDWLYGTTTPPMPGHPDWMTNPVTGQAKALARAPRARPVP